MTDLYPSPKLNIYTIYSKSGCINCVKAKELLKSKNISFEIIDCDEYLFDDKSGFLNFIKQISNYNQDIKYFPIIFNLSNKLLSGFDELKSDILNLPISNMSEQIDLTNLSINDDF